MVLFFVGISLVFVGLGWPLYRGKVKPNHWYGLRVGETMEDERVWYAANAYSGRDFVVLGVLVSAIAVILWPIMGHKEDPYVVVNTVIMTGGAIVVAARGLMVARKYKEFFAEQDVKK